MISDIELALNHISPAELLERAATLASLIEDGFAFLAAGESGHTILVVVPAPELPPLPPGLA